MRILVIHASAGNGHKRAAEAIERAYARLPEPRPEVSVIDALDFAPGKFKRLYVGSFESTVKHAPWFFGAIFRGSSEAARFRAFRAIRRIFNRIVAHDLCDEVARRDPDVVVCTHFLSLDALSRRKRRGRLRAALACVVTDYIAHGYWVEPSADRYYAPVPEVAKELVKRGVPRSRVLVTGIPVDPVFGEPPSREEARARVAAPEGRRLALVLGGGLGMGPVAEIVEGLGTRSDLPLALDVVCGKNATLRSEVEALAPKLAIPVRVHGFVSDVPLRMAAADFVVTKPGGLTTSEAIATGRPMLLFEAMPGQERGNADYFVGAGAALEITPGNAADTIGRLLADAGALARVVDAARAISRPHAARDIAMDSLRLEPGVRRVRALPGAAGIG